MAFFCFSVYTGLRQMAVIEICQEQASQHHFAI
jgi:hypothetical protein